MRHGFTEERRAKREKRHVFHREESLPINFLFVYFCIRCDLLSSFTAYESEVKVRDIDDTFKMIFNRKIVRFKFNIRDLSYF